MRVEWVLKSGGEVVGGKPRYVDIPAEDFYGLTMQEAEAIISATVKAAAFKALDAMTFEATYSKVELSAATNGGHDEED